MDTIDRPNRVVLDPPEVVWAHIKMRRWRLIRRIAAVLTLAGLVGSLAYVANYQPVRRSNAGGCGFGTATVTMNNPILSAGECVAEFEPGKVLGYGFTVLNEGPLPIRIEAIGGPTNSWIDSTRIVVGSHQIFGLQGTAPFAPFTLRSGEGKNVFVLHTFAECSESTGPGGATGWTDIPIRYRVLGISRTDDVPLRTGVAIRTGDACLR